MKFEMAHDKRKEEYALLTVTTKEAISIISSLCGQIESMGPNVGRIDFTSDNGTHVAICVIDER